VNCVICEIRKPRRECPGVHGQICTICCGAGREQTIDCPLDCTYLRDAHEHEKMPELDPAVLPNRDIQITEEFLRQNEVLMGFLAMTIFEGAIKTPGPTDWDVREALDSLVNTWRALQAGLYTETRPVNVYAADIAAWVQSRLKEVTEKEKQARGTTSIRDADVLKVLAFLQRLEYTHNNGRKRSRAFIDFLTGFYNPETATESAVEPNEPRIIL
jgi:hypothetical protein